MTTTMKTLEIIQIASGVEIFPARWNGSLYFPHGAVFCEVTNHPR